MAETTCYSILDYGYVSRVETWGSDENIIRAARMSTQGGFKGWGTRDADGIPHIGDEKLLRYLYEHKHSSPFEMAGAIFEVHAPIFVFREWHRHRTQSYNEASARYAPLAAINYVPSIERLLVRSSASKQSAAIAGAPELTEAKAQRFRTKLAKLYGDAEDLYQDALSDGVPKELARVCLPVGRYSCMRASANLHNWLRFLRLRLNEAAQWEIRQYANAVAEILRGSFPRTMALFDEETEKLSK